MAFWLQADIDALRTAIASGILTVSYDGPPKREITYQSLTAMRSLLAEMRSDVDEVVKYRRTKHAKGFRE